MRHIAHSTRAACLSVLVFLLCAQPAAADLVGYWSFDDETASDLSGNENNGEVLGLDFSEDVPNDVGRSLRVFDGGTVRVTSSESLGMADTLTVAYWMKADNGDQGSNWNGPMGKISDPREAGGWEMQRFEDQSRLDIRIDTPGADGGPNAVRGNLTGTFDDVWVHVAWTVDSGMWASYLDGEFVANGDYPHGDGFANEADLFFGNRGNCCAYTGLLDEIALYNNVISEEEIMNLAAGIPPLMLPENPGDFNGDGVVDTVDYNIMVSNFNETFPVLESFEKGDTNLNGRVDLRDFLNFREIFDVPAGAVAASVPEPMGTTLGMSGLIATALALACKRRKVVRT